MIMWFSSCEKEPQLCSLYGVVTDLASGEPVGNAGVELLPLGLKSVTGSDGTFEFTNIEEGTYRLLITKTGYQDHTSNDIVVNAKSDGSTHSIQIEKLPPSLSLLDDEGNEVTILDFGSNPEVVMRSFFIFNKGEEKLEWSIVYACNWISSISKQSGELKSGASQPLVIEIDRSRLNMGDNSTTIHFVSNSGTRQIEVLASSNNVLETLETTDIRAGSAVLNAKITRDLNPSIHEYGFVYSKTAAPTIRNGANKVQVPGVPPIGSQYNSLISNLEKETYYYARAYVTNGTDTLYGNQVSFKTVEGLPIVKTLNSKNVSSSSAIIECEVVDDQGASITARGVCYSLTPLPTTDGKHTNDGTGVGKWDSPLSNLSANATYYIRAYATNSFGTGYGEQLEVTTTEGLAVVRTGEITAVTSNSASCSGEVVSDGDRQVTERGICWRKSAYPTTNDTHATNGTGVGTFKCSMTNLEAGVEYHVRAYAINSAGTVYGEDKTFTTSSVAPSVTTQTATNVTSSSATISGTITSTGGSSITEAGFKYKAEGEYSEHTIKTQVSNGKISYQLTNLTPGTKYFVQAYARNAQGVGEGTTITFTTSSGLPQVSTSSSPTVSSTSAVVFGNIVSDGGFQINECGICYSSSNKKPTTSDKYVQNPTAQIGQFSCEITNLDPSTTYYARAYARNANGIAYGSAISFKTTNGMPAVTISQQPTYNGNSATVYGQITSDGGADILYYGVVLSRVSQSPSIDNREAILTEEGAPITNNISFTITNIPSGSMFYYRFYVVNSLAKVAYSSSGYIMGY